MCVGEIESPTLLEGELYLYDVMVLRYASAGHGYDQAFPYIRAEEGC